MATLEGEKDYKVDEIDRNQKESDGFESNSFRRNHDVKVCTNFPFFHYFLFNNIFL